MRFGMRRVPCWYFVRLQAGRGMRARRGNNPHCKQLQGNDGAFAIRTGRLKRALLSFLPVEKHQFFFSLFCSAMAKVSSWTIRAHALTLPRFVAQELEVRMKNWFRHSTRKVTEGYRLENRIRHHQRPNQKHWRCRKLAGLKLFAIDPSFTMLVFLVMYVIVCRFCAVARTSGKKLPARQWRTLYALRNVRRLFMLVLNIFELCRTPVQSMILQSYSAVENLPTLQPAILHAEWISKADYKYF